MTAVDARFAGGTLIVDQAVDVLDPARRLVTLDIPGCNQFGLFPDEARAVAAALVVAAAEADRLRTVRRRAGVDEGLRGIDG